MKILHEHSIDHPSGGRANLTLRCTDKGELEHHMVCVVCKAENVIPAVTPEDDAQIFMAWLNGHAHSTELSN